jgi:hypothetical protein
LLLAAIFVALSVISYILSPVFDAPSIVVASAIVAAVVEYKLTASFLATAVAPAIASAVSCIL